TSRWWPRSRVAHMVKSFGRRGTATVHADPPDLVSLLLATVWAAKIQLLSRAISPATAIASVITPLALATASLLLAGNDPGQRSHAILASILIGAWTNDIITCARDMQHQLAQGTLELLSVAPA